MDHSDVVGASPVSAAPTYIRDLTVCVSSNRTGQIIFITESCEIYNNNNYNNNNNNSILI